MECLNNLRVNVRRLRLLQGLTQQATADRAGIDGKYYQAIESGRWPNLKLSTVEKIADALAVKPWELICDPPSGSKAQPARKRGVRSKIRKNSGTVVGAVARP